MRRSSHYGSSTQKQLVRPFLSSPVTLFAYLLLILSGIGLLEWVLRASAHTQATPDLETRAAWPEQHHDRVKLVPKHEVSFLTSSTHRAGALKRQNGSPLPSVKASGSSTPKPAASTTKKPPTSAVTKPPASSIAKASSLTTKASSLAKQSSTLSTTPNSPSSVTVQPFFSPSASSTTEYSFFSPDPSSPTEDPTSSSTTDYSYFSPPPSSSTDDSSSTTEFCDLYATDCYYSSSTTDDLSSSSTECNPSHTFCPPSSTTESSTISMECDGTHTPCPAPSTATTTTESSTTSMECDGTHTPCPPPSTATTTTESSTTSMECDGTHTPCPPPSTATTTTESSTTSMECDGTHTPCPPPSTATTTTESSTTSMECDGTHTPCPPPLTTTTTTESSSSLPECDGTHTPCFYPPPTTTTTIITTATESSSPLPECDGTHTPCFNPPTTTSTTTESSSTSMECDGTHTPCPPPTTTTSTTPSTSTSTATTTESSSPLPECDGTHTPCSNPPTTTSTTTTSSSSLVECDGTHTPCPPPTSTTTMTEITTTVSESSTSATECDPSHADCYPPPPPTTTTTTTTTGGHSLAPPISSTTTPITTTTRSSTSLSTTTRSSTPITDPQLSTSTPPSFLPPTTPSSSSGILISSISSLTSTATSSQSTTVVGTAVVFLLSSTATLSLSNPVSTTQLFPAIVTTSAAGQQFSSLSAFTTSGQPSSITPIAAMSLTTSQNTITPLILPTTISGAENSVATSTAVAGSSCRHGLLCLFANRHEAVPLSQGYRTLRPPVDKVTEFAANYAPIIVVILLQTFWLIIYASIRLNEPFHQLAQPGGTPVETGLSFEFLSTGFPVNHFRAGFGGNWTGWYMVAAYLVLLILMVAPSLAAEAFSVQNMKTYCVRSSSNNECIQRVWTIAVGPVRALQVCLIIIAILVLIVFVVRTYRGSALSLKKVNLALIASTLNDSQTVDHLHNVNPEGSAKASTLTLQNRLWALEPSIATEIGSEHGSYILRSRVDETATAPSTSPEPTEPTPKQRGPPRPLLNLLLPAFIIMFLLLLVIMYASNGIDDSKLTFFFGSVSFGPKFFLVSMATILGVALCRVEHEIRVLTLYRSLHAASNPLPILLRRLHPSPLTQAFAAFKHDEWVCALMSFMAGYGANILAMTISNVPYHPGLSVPATIACIFTSIFLLVMMAVALIAVAIWRRGNSHLGIQEWPDTLAHIYLLMVHSRIPGVRVVEEANENVTEFFGETHEKKPTVVQRTVEIGD